jgi:phosphatidylinositol alpha-1,6-mannosyltransferase
MKDRYDIVHTQDGELVGGDVVTAHSLLRVVLRTFRDEDPAYASWIPKSPLLWCEDWIYGARRYRRVIATSEKMRSALRAVYGIPEADIAVIPLGVDTDVFRPNPAARVAFRLRHQIEPHELVLLHVSTDFERKGLRTIVESLQALGPEVTLVVAGLGDELPFRQQARKLGVRNHLIFLGYQEHLADVYASADLFVFPTRLDFFGYPVVEAMASGLPSLTAKDAGVAELIRDGRNGFVLDRPRDSRELSERIRTALASDLRAVAREARATAEETSTDSMVVATKNVYEEILRR